MSKQIATVVYLLVMVAVIVGLDVSLLRDRIGLRLAVNVAIVLVFLGFYFAVIRRI